MHQKASDRNQKQPLDATLAVDTRRGNPIDTNTQNKNMTDAKSQDMHQHASERNQKQPLDATQAVDTRRGNPEIPIHKTQG